jgi:uncharacterized peroxidase-related enzyme
VSEPTSPTALDLPPVDPLPTRTATYFETCAEKLGLVPNVLRAYAFDIDRLEAFTTLYNALMLGPSGLSKLEREMIAVVVSVENDCHYCQAAHGSALRALSDDPALTTALLSNYRAAALSPRHRAMLDFALAATTRSATIEEADREALRAVGFTDRDIWDIAEVAAFFNMSNRLASATGMRPNPEYLR